MTKMVKFKAAPQTLAKAVPAASDVIAAFRTDVLEGLSRADNAQGVTAAFDLNLLIRKNRERPIIETCLRHKAVGDADASRVELCPESLTDQVVTVAGRWFSFQEGEPTHRKLLQIWTCGLCDAG